MEKQFFKLSELIVHFKENAPAFFEMNLLAVDQRKPYQGYIRIDSIQDILQLSSFVIEIDSEQHGTIPFLLNYVKSEDDLVYFEILNVTYKFDIRNVITRLSTLENLVAANNFNNPVRLVKYVSDFEEKIEHIRKSKASLGVNVQEALLEKIPLNQLLTELEKGRTCYIKIKSIYGKQTDVLAIEYETSWLVLKLWMIEDDNYFLYSMSYSELYLMNSSYLQQKKQEVSWYMERE